MYYVSEVNQNFARCGTRILRVIHGRDARATLKLKTNYGASRSSTSSPMETSASAYITGWISRRRPTIR
jgi:hypothetical protein